MCYAVSECCFAVSKVTILSFPEFLLCLEDATRTRTALWTSCNLSKTKQDLDINHHFNSQNCALHPTEGLHLHLKWLILISSRTPKWRNAAAMCLVTPRLGKDDITSFKHVITLTERNLVFSSADRARIVLSALFFPSKEYLSPSFLSSCKMKGWKCHFN